MLDKLIADTIKQAVKAAANSLVDLASPTASDSEDGGSLSYGYLILGASLNVECGVGNGHTAQLAANVNGKPFGPATNQLAFDAGANEPLIGQILTIHSDISVGSLSPNPPPLPLVTISLFQRRPQEPGKRVLLETFNVKGTFDANNFCKLATPILLK